MCKQVALAFALMGSLPLPVLAQAAKDAAPAKEITVFSPWGLVIVFSALIIGYGAGWVFKKR